VSGSFTPRPLYHRDQSPCCPFDRLGGPQSRSTRVGDENKNPIIAHHWGRNSRDSEIYLNCIIWGKQLCR